MKITEQSVYLQYCKTGEEVHLSYNYAMLTYVTHGVMSI